MLDENSIFKKLEELGVDKENFNGIVADVMQVVSSKALSTSLLQLPESDRSLLKNMPQEEFLDYVTQGKLPQLSSQEFEKIYIETWENYFNSIR